MITKYILFILIILSLNDGCDRGTNKNITEKIINELTDSLSEKWHIQKDTVVKFEIKGSYLFAYEQYCNLSLNLNEAVLDLTSGGVNGKLDSIPAQYLNIECYKIKSNNETDRIFGLINQKINELQDPTKQAYYCIEDKSMRINRVFSKSNILLVVAYEGFDKETTEDMIDILKNDFFRIVK